MFHLFAYQTPITEDLTIVEALLISLSLLQTKMLHLPRQNGTRESALETRM